MGEGLTFRWHAPTLSKALSARAAYAEAEAALRTELDRLDSANDADRAYAQNGLYPMLADALEHQGRTAEAAAARMQARPSDPI